MHARHVPSDASTAAAATDSRRLGKSLALKPEVTKMQLAPLAT